MSNLGVVGARRMPAKAAGWLALLGSGALVLASFGGAAGQQPPELPPGPVRLPPADKGRLPPEPQPAIPGVRMPRLADKGALGSTPKPTPQEQAEYNQFIEGVVDPRHVLDLVQGRTRLVLLKETPTQIQVADETTANYQLLNPRQLSVLGLKVGTTVLTLWFPDPKVKGRERILSYLVRVIPDPEARERQERAYKALADEINHAFPDSHVCITMVGDKLVVSGQAKDIFEGTQIIRIVRANAPKEEGAPGRIPVDTVNVNVAPGDLLHPEGTPGLSSFLTAGGPNVVNLLRIPGEKQVMLRVTVAEINRAAARSIGLNFSITNSAGVTVFGQNTGQLGTAAGAAASTGNLIGNLGNQNAQGALANLIGNLDNGRIPLAINALRTLNYARSLAEPNLVAMNGQTANFLAGGQFPVPVVSGFGNVTGQNNGIGGLQGVFYIPFGVQLSFTPYITDRDRIRLNMSAVVSTRSLQTGAVIAGANVAGLTTRNFQTTVELREGQTLAVAGLIQNNLGAEAQRVPFFGDLPFIGRLAAYDTIQHGEQELVVLVTPELVHPLEPKEVPPLPGADLFEPGDIEFYLLGRLESRRPYDYRSSVMTDLHRMLRYRRCEELYIFGPKGHAGPAPALPPAPPAPLAHP